MIGVVELQDLAARLGISEVAADLVDVAVDRVVIDSREVVAGDLFVALQGENHDAHEFLTAVADACAAAAVVERKIDSALLPQLITKDSSRALGEVARINRQRFTRPLIGLTGSCGKTTVKEILATILTGVGDTLATEGNFNNQIGMPLTLLRLTNQHDFAVIEMGTSFPGEIGYLASIAEPNVALVNNVMAAHLEGLGSEEGVAKEKSDIYRQLAPGGTAIFNQDISYASVWQEEMANVRPDVRQLTFALNKPADVIAANLCVDRRGCYGFNLHYEGVQKFVQLNILGRQNVSNALASAACAIAAGLTLDQVVAGLHSVQPIKGRLATLEAGESALVIDDTYNANPGSVVAAANVLVDLAQFGKKNTLVLGDLAELGENAEVMLRALGKTLQEMGLEHLVTVGRNSALVSGAFQSALQNSESDFQGAQHFSDVDILVAWLSARRQHDQVFLFKGSRSARMEAVIDRVWPQLRTQAGVGESH